MRRVTKIMLRRAEGPSAECTDWLEVADFDEADQMLKKWALTAPGEGGGYDKCDFKVIYDNDGNDDPYEGRFDLVYDDHAKHGLLQEHMRAFILWYFDLATRDRETGELVLL